MNSRPSDFNCKAAMAYSLAILGAFLIVAGLVWAMRHYTQPPPLDAGRAAQRAKALADLRASEAEALSTPAWIDQSKGIVRLPIDVAIQIVEREWQNPSAARSNLIARVEKATAPAPQPAAKPNPFE